MTTILLIDDSPDIRALVRSLLEQGGHQVLEADVAEDRLRRASEGRPHLILTDLAKPGIFGRDVVRRLKEDPGLTGLPVLALTAHTM